MLNTQPLNLLTSQSFSIGQYKLTQLTYNTIPHNDPTKISLSMYNGPLPGDYYSYGYQVIGVNDVNTVSHVAWGREHLIGDGGRRYSDSMTLYCSSFFTFNPIPCPLLDITEWQRCCIVTLPCCSNTQVVAGARPYSRWWSLHRGWSPLAAADLLTEPLFLLSSWNLIY